jgi:cytochrome c oxidase cbb3-type subunit III
MKLVPLAFGICLAVFTAGCQREMANERPAPAERIAFTAAREVDLLPGGPVPEVKIPNPYQNNVYAISEGHRLFIWYHCAGCHGGEGGGAIGPPLRDPVWIYGSAPDNIFDTIVKGRPNGMPSWGGRIPEYQIWQLVAYVRSMAGLEAAPRMGQQQMPEVSSR